MWGKPIGPGKSRWYPAIAIASATFLCLISAWIVLGRSLSQAPTPSADLDFPQDSTSHSTSKATPPSEPPAIATPSPVAPISTPSPQAANPSPSQASPGVPFTRQGVLRISNPTDYPIRVALLARIPATGETSANKQSDYDVPAHWDFAPQEGATKGLIVSLPDRTLKLRKGDVLVAFAQDGSRRYWGPYVVGETENPLWNPKAKEWELILQP